MGAVVATSTQAHRPNLLCDYLYETANVFNRFYREERVLNAATESDKKRRLALVESTARVLERGFELLGIEPLDRM